MFSCDALDRELFFCLFVYRVVPWFLFMFSCIAADRDLFFVCLCTALDRDSFFCFRASPWAVICFVLLVYRVGP